MSDKMTLQEWSDSEYIKQLQSQLTEAKERETSLIRQIDQMRTLGDMELRLKRDMAQQLKLTEAQEENKRLRLVLEKLCEQVESWEMSVVSIIGRQPQTGMCTKDARDVLNGGNVK